MKKILRCFALAVLLAAALAASCAPKAAYVSKEQIYDINKKLYELKSLRFQHTLSEKRDSLPENAHFEAEELSRTASEYYIADDFETAIIFIDKALDSIQDAGGSREK